MKYLGYIFVGFIILFVGYAIGRTPTTQEETLKNQTAQYIADTRQVAADSQTLAGLCEEKYQQGIAGNMYNAYQIKGQMDALQAKINSILSKYNTTAL